jgi:hypothetical protein
MNKLILHTLSILFLFFSSVHSAEEKFSNTPGMNDSKRACNAFFEKIIKSDDNLIRDFYTTNSYDVFGFWFKSVIDKKTGLFEYLRDSDNNFVVGNIYNNDTASKIKGDDTILSINGITATDLEEYEKIMYDDKIDEIKIVLLNKDNKKYETTLKRQDTNIQYLKYTIKDLNFTDIDIKKGTYKISIINNLEYSYTKSPDDYKKDHPIISYALGTILYYNYDNKINSYHACRVPKEMFDKRDLLNPSRDVIIKNVLENDKDLEKVKTTIYPYHKWIGSKYNEIRMIQERSSVYEIKNSYNLKSFPFDKQILKFQLASESWGLESLLIEVDNVSHKVLEKFINNDDIPGWKKKSFNLKKEPYHLVTHAEGKYHDSVVLSILIERKPGYYLFKVIFPILLILLICWSVVWVDPKELESRLTITIVCLLSLIAYNFVIDSELPKLEYLTVLDWIILVSYIYATIPNLLSVISFRLLKINLPLGNKIEEVSKRYGLASYISIIFLIILLNVNANSEYSANYLSWIKLK